MSKDENKPAAATEPAYTKEQFLQSKDYQGKKDLIRALLRDGMTYTKTAVDRIIDDYMKKKV